jgi:hypothetical protein
MDEAKIHEAIQPERLKAWLKAAFAEVGITTEELLKDDGKVEKAALIAYEKIPLLPFRAVIKATIGKDGFTKLVFGIRDKMIELKSADLFSLNFEHIKSILTKMMKDKQSI